MSDIGLGRVDDIAGELVGRVRSVIRGVLRRPGDVYQVVYVGPLTSARGLWLELKRQAAVAGLDAIQSYDDWRSAGYRPAVVLMSIDGLKAYKDATGHRSRPGSQIISWGSQGFSELPKELRDWLKVVGLYVEPEIIDGVGTGKESSDEEVREAMTRCRVAAGAKTKIPHNPLTVVVRPGQEDEELFRVSLRLEAGGLKVQRQEAPAGQRSGVDALVCRVRVDSLEAMDEQAASVAGYIEENKLVVMLCNGAELDRARGHGPWREILLHGEVLRLSGEYFPQADDAWPAPRDVLVGAPRTREGDPKYETRWNEMIEGELPRLMDFIPEVSRRAGTHEILIYGPDRFAQFVVGDGKFLDSCVSGDDWTVDELVAKRGGEQRDGVVQALLLERLWRVLKWPSSQVLVARIEGRDGQDAEDIDSLLNASFGIDDSRPRLAGIGPDCVWGVVSREAAQRFAMKTGGPIIRVTAAIDGIASNREVAQKAGVLPLELAIMLETLARADIIRLVYEGEAAVAGQLDRWYAHWSTAMVACALVEHGMPRAAVDVLRMTSDQGIVVGQAAGRLDAEALFVMAYAMVLQDGASREAATVFERAWVQWRDQGAGNDRQAYMNRKLDAALVSARAGVGDWSQVWRTIARELKSISVGGQELRWTARHYLIIGELAFRAGDMMQAQKAAERLDHHWKQVGNLAERPRWVVELIGNG